MNIKRIRLHTTIIHSSLILIYIIYTLSVASCIITVLSLQCLLVLFYSLGADFYLTICLTNNQKEWNPINRLYYSLFWRFQNLDLGSKRSNLKILIASIIIVLNIFCIVISR